MAEGKKGIPAAPEGMRALEAQVRTCQLCRLGKTRTNAVPGEGNPRAEVLFIGEGPGYHEDRQGRPFVGPAGQFLNELLGLAGLRREEVYIANVVKCRPPNNRDPLPDEIAACAPYLERQIALIDPRVIVTLGRYSMVRFFAAEKISQIHGTAKVIDGRLCVAMYHPAAGLHQQSLADVIRADFRKLPVYLEQARLMGAPRTPSTNGHVERAEAARDAVVHSEETGTVPESPTTSEQARSSLGEAQATEPMLEATEAPEAEPPAGEAADVDLPAEEEQATAEPEVPGGGDTAAPRQLSLFDI